MAKSDGSSYFRRASLFWIVTVTLSMSYYTWAVFWPQKLPYDTLGPLGAFTKYLVKEYHSFMYKGWWLAWAVHLCEALVALKVCSDKGIDSPSTRLLWFVQTLLFGFASLALLLKYKAGGRAKRH
ncbi:transmembrane protein 254 [Silurus meridionalis]|uniref:transmembrane protein 254 n=1 Tax=Silurus meridionalis TaxID=175797 RepID=UPI001EEB3DAA|nr:transmembrane protein 254 [Silurus meridionalis]KAI5107899.1 transmembrane protein 254 [Silurus meridionalis]